MNAVGCIDGQVQDAVLAQVRAAVEADTRRTLTVGIQKKVEAFPCAETAGLESFASDIIQIR